MLTVARPTHCIPYAHCYKALSVPNASLLQGSLVQGIISALAIYASLLQCSLLQGIISALCLPVTAARHHQFPMPPCHCCKASSVPYAFLSLLQGIISALCLPVTAARHHQCPMPPCTAARHHQCPMPPYYKAHCCKASSVPYASLLQDTLLQAPLPAYIASVLCVIIAFIQRCVGLCFIPVMVWSGLCFIPRRSGLVWSGLVCVLYPTITLVFRGGIVALTRSFPRNYP